MGAIVSAFKPVFYAFVSGLFHVLVLAGAVVKSTPVCLMLPL